MANKLKIYACSGVGDSQDQQNTFDYWLDNNNNIIRNTQAVNILFAMIDEAYTELTVLHPSKERMIELLNTIDFYCICLFCAQEYSDDPEGLEAAGKVLGSLYKKGVFFYNSVKNSKRDAHLDELYNTVASAINNPEGYEGDAQFTEWWNNEVIQKNHPYLSQDDQELLKNCILNAAKGVEGIGAMDDSWKNDEKISKYLNEAQNYFLYLYFTEKQLARLPKVFTDKFNDQYRVYDNCLAFFTGVYGTQADFNRIINTQITKAFGQSPKEVCRYIASGKKMEGIGFAWATFVSVLTALTPIIIAVIKGVIEYCKSRDIAKYQSISSNIVNRSIPEGSDGDGLYFPSDMVDNIKKYSPYIIGAFALMYILKNR